MSGGRVLLLSAVAHAAAAGVLSQIALEGKPQRSVRVSHAPEPAPMEVEVLEMPPPGEVRTPQPAPAAVVAAPRDVVPAPHASSRSSGAPAALAASQQTARTESASGTPGRQPNGTLDTTSLMHMRGVDLSLDPGTAQRIAESGERELPPSPTVSGKLDKASGGRAVIHDRVTTMNVEQDGSAHFDDKKDIDLHFQLPIPHLDVKALRHDLGNTLAAWYADPYAGSRFGRSQELSNINLAVPGTCDSWADLGCDDPLAPGAEKAAREGSKIHGPSIGLGIGFGGAADITAYLHRKYVGDPYASRKLRLLDETRDERVTMGAEFRAHQLARSAELIDRNLARLASSQLSPIERRATMFELWDECAEPTGTENDDVGQAGQRARAQVIGSIRSQLPKGSSDAYSTDEIAQLNRRRSSKQRFEPY